MPIHMRLPTSPPSPAQDTFSKCISWASATAVQLSPAGPAPRAYFSKAQEPVSRDRVEAILKLHPKYKPVLARETIPIPPFLERWADPSDLSTFRAVQLSVLEAEKALAEQKLWQAPGGCTAQLERQLIEDRLERARIEVQLYSQAIANADELPRLMFVDAERHSTDTQMSVDDPTSPLSMSPDPEFERMSDLDQTSMSSIDSIGLPMLSTLDNITMPTFPPVMDTFGSEISMPDVLSPCRREFGPVPESDMSSVVS